ncbi:hypothetical protein HJG53_00970 [Sphingomonas sp. ID1715]|uniref:hypothetical protein n=1 Tax=Sphingomonas sp. ID1715 TaxID=1656898 RepID=UPI00148895B0|nr:hypothetical protein [Sphingomonas sp. ID1715]NNM75480.1 hypothetical protein [Sphingomonas sp. ID1715]
MDLKGNLSTEHQLPGDAKRPDSATLDKNRTPEDEGSDRGQRPFIAGNGEVRGSGAGAGGGNLREDYDNDAVGGGGDLAEAPGVNDGEEDQIHQAVENQSNVSPDDYPEKNSMRDADKG